MQKVFGYPEYNHSHLFYHGQEIFYKTSRGYMRGVPGDLCQKRAVEPHARPVRNLFSDANPDRKQIPKSEVYVDSPLKSDRMTEISDREADQL